MTIRACIVFPIWFTLSRDQESEYSKLPSSEREEYLLSLADHYLLTSDVEPLIEYVEETDLSEEQTAEYNQLSEPDKDEYLLMVRNKTSETGELP